jgi:hypothetical protein
VIPQLPDKLIFLRLELNYYRYVIEKTAAEKNENCSKSRP